MVKIFKKILCKPINFIKSNSFYSKFILKGSLCFDVGANIGNRTSIFLRLGAKVIAIEPQSDCTQIIKNRFKGNKNLVIEQVAVSDKVERLEFYLANKNECSTLSTSFMERYGIKDFLEWNTKELVETTTLDILIEKYGIPDFCKIDVENYELNVLKGLHKKISVIAFEFNHPFIENTISCIQLLKQKGFNQFNYIVFEEFSFKSKIWMSDVEITQVLRLLPVNIATGEIFAR